MAMYIVNAKSKKLSAVSVVVSSAMEALSKSKELTDAGFTQITVLDNRGREISDLQLQAALPVIST